MSAYAEWLGRQPTDDRWPAWHEEGCRLGWINGEVHEPREDGYREAVVSALTTGKDAPGEVVGLADYLDDVHGYLTRYVAWPGVHEPVAVALWVAHTWLVERFDVSPILAVTSAEMRSGKTRVLDCLELLVPNPYRMVLPSEAVFYSLLGRRPRVTVLLDEVDAIFGKRPSERTEGLRAVLNSGNQQGTPVLRVRLEGKHREVEEFDVYGAKAVAGIGELPATVADRSIPIRMRRRAPDEPVARFRKRGAKAEAEALVLPDWSAVTLVPDVTHVPDGMSDRASDGWEPLLAIADAAGGDWPARARASAIALSAEEDAPVSIGIRLLGDIRDVFPIYTHASTTTLLQALHGLEDAPWGDWYGAPLTARGLAKLLGPYGIGPQLRRVDGEPIRGYWRQDFTDAWHRYVPAPAAVTSGTSVTPELDPSVWDAERATDDDAEQEAQA